VQVTWKPYQIDPGTALNGEDFEAYCRRRWGGSGWTNHLKREGSRDGASFWNWKWWPNTTRAHQWILYGVEKHGADTDRLNSVLFQALYEDGQNISLVETLVALGRTEFSDCDADDLRDYLENNKGKVAVQQEIAEGRTKYNIRSVPFFVIGLEGSPAIPYGLSGAQPASAFQTIFEELAEE
jgi:predicted DsbA family dithiol-disulfide isomerase